MFVANKSNLHNKDLHETQKKKPHEKVAESKTSGCNAILRCNIICYDCSSTNRTKKKMSREREGEKKNETDLNPIWTWTAHKVFALYMQMLMLLMKKDHKKYYSLSGARWKFVETRKMCVLPFALDPSMPTLIPIQQISKSIANAFFVHFNSRNEINTFPMCPRAQRSYSRQQFKWKSWRKKWIQLNVEGGDSHLSIQFLRMNYNETDNSMRIEWYQW